VIAVTAEEGLATQGAHTGFQVRLKHEGCHVDDRNHIPPLTLCVAAAAHSGRRQPHLRFLGDAGLVRRCGRDLSRDGFIEKLEGLRQLDTGYAPPLTFGPSRRLGAHGAWLVRLDLAAQRLEPEGGWVEAE